MTGRLTNLCLLNTRPAAQASMLTQAITAEGGRCIEFPVLDIEALPDNWVSKLPALNTVSQAIFISANAVHYCFNALDKAGLHWPEQIEIIAIGTATAQSLNDRKQLKSRVPVLSNSESLVNIPELLSASEGNILLFKGIGGRTLIADTLRARGLNLTCIDVYRRGLPTVDEKKIKALWNNTDIDIILLTSEQSINNLLILLGEAGKDWLCEKPCIVFGERLAKVATRAGIKQVILSSPDALLNSLYQFNQGLIHGQHRQRTKSDF